MTTRLFITSAEGHAGKSIVALGVVETLSRTVARVGVFRPVARSSSEHDSVLDILLAHDAVHLSYDDAIGTTYEQVHDNPEAALAEIVTRFKAIESRFDAIVIVGSDYTDVGSPTELSFNAAVAANLGAPVLLVLGGVDPDSGSPRTPAQMRQLAELTIPELRDSHATLIAVLANRVEADSLQEVESTLREELPGLPVWAIPDDPLLSAPSVQQLFDATDAELISGDAGLLTRESLGTVVAGMSMENVLDRLIEGGLLVVPGDRADVVVGTLLAQQSDTFPNVSGIVLNGGLDLPESVQRLLEGLNLPLPIGKSPHGTFDTAKRIVQTRGSLAGSQRKRDTALASFDQHVDAGELLGLLEVDRTTVVTPLMFEHSIVDRAKSSLQHIVLPEGSDDRILQAAATIEHRGIATLTVLGEEQEVRARAAELGLDLGGVRILSTKDPELSEKYAVEYQRVRAHKGVTLDQARDVVTDVSYFGTMMVFLGDADGMVSGAAHTTAHTIRPSFETIKTAPGVKVVSSVFLMALADRVLVYGDCAVIPEPTAEELADIAISSAATAQNFGIEPRVAMLSYSTGDSGSGADVEKVRAATALVRERAPELAVEGPIQYDAAADMTVAAKKMPDSAVAGRATVFVFPDLNTGNNTYKAVQRSAGALAIGPVLQGLAKPINDLSRGALVDDIVNTVAITAIQAQSEALGQEVPKTATTEGTNE
ncbi:phosphate acetyltransferase [Humidisolicoccus flavus]|uniref:phosphate acetyltransferase n=1 Tax=Humidisolicoccus flavus TaxID=3111414 RepID=UPI00324E4A48